MTTTLLALLLAPFAFLAAFAVEGALALGALAAAVALADALVGLLGRGWRTARALLRLARRRAGAPPALSPDEG